jgi:hypothetical protein
MTRQPEGSSASGSRSRKELEQLTPVEQDVLFDASVVTDLDQVPAAFSPR